MYLKGAIAALLSLSATVVSAQEKTILHIAAPPLAFHELPLFVGVEKGFFAAEGLDVDLRFMRGGNEAAAALASGSIDVIVSGLTNPFILRTKKMPIKILCGVSGLYDVGIVVDAKRHGDVKDIRGLKGLRVAVARRGTALDLMTRFLLEDAGLNPERDVDLIQIGGYANHLLAMQKGDADASLLPEPFYTSAVEQGIGKSIFDLLKGDGPALLHERIATGLVVTEDFLKNRSEIGSHLVRAIKRSTELIYADPAAGFAVLKKYFPNIPEGTLHSIFNRLLAAKSGRAFTVGITPAAINAENEFLLRSGTIKAPVAYNDIVAIDMKPLW